jgi:hypothetical protein
MIAVSITIPVMIAVATVTHAAKLAIDIFNASATTGEGLERRIHPAPIAVLAPRP